MDASRHTHSDSKEKGMSVDPRAGKLPDPSMLANIPRLMTAYYMTAYIYQAGAAG